MMTEERTRFEVLLESIETQVKVIAEGHGVLAEGQRALVEGQRMLIERTDALAEGQRMLIERVDRMERKFEIRFDVLESRFITLETKVDGLEVFASDAQGRLKRIETHVQLKHASRPAPRHLATSAAPSKRRRKM